MTLAEKIVSLRRTLHRLLTRRLAEETERPFLQLRLLHAMADGRVATQTEAGDRLLMDPASVCRMVDRLEEDGLVDRCPGKDRRSGRLALTSSAQAEVAVMTGGLGWLDERVKGLLTSAEYDRLGALLTKLQLGLDDPSER